MKIIAPAVYTAYRTESIYPSFIPSQCFFSAFPHMDKQLFYLKPNQDKFAVLILTLIAQKTSNKGHIMVLCERATGKLLTPGWTPKVVLRFLFFISMRSWKFFHYWSLLMHFISLLCISPGFSLMGGKVPLQCARTAGCQSFKHFNRL